MTKKRNIKPRARPAVFRDTFDPEPAATSAHARQDSTDSPFSFVEEDNAEENVPANTTSKEGNKKMADEEEIHVEEKPAEKLGEIMTRQIVSLDGDRGLSKKQEGLVASKWHGKNHQKAKDAYWRRQSEEARKTSSTRGVFVGDESKKLVVGIPMFGGHGAEARKYPGCLPMEFVITQDSFPLGFIYQLVAKFGIGKSGLLAEFGRWFDLAGGGLEINENESKFSPEWYESIMGREAFQRMVLHRCQSLEDWERSLSEGIKRHKLAMLGTKDNPGPGRIMPVLFGVDSIMGKMSESVQEKILGKRIDVQDDDGVKTSIRGITGTGEAGGGWPVEAKIITRYLRSIPQELDNWPFAIVLINHLRITKDDMGHDVRNKTGGEQINFQESFEIELRRVSGKKRIDAANFEGFNVEIGCEKNSFGSGVNRRVQTRVLWWEEPNPTTGELEQKTIWDWDWSTVHLLNAILNGKGSVRLRKCLRDEEIHLECPESGDVENRAWSRNLGMKSAKEAVPWNELGAMIRYDHKLLNQLRRGLRIKRRPLLKGDYLSQVDDLSTEMP